MTQGSSEVLSTREIFTIRELVFDVSFKFQLGEYVEANEDTYVTNTNRSRTYPGIYLGPIYNIQGNLKMFDLKTGVVKNIRSAMDFSIPHRFLELVNVWGKISCKEEKNNQLQFLDQNKQKFDWNNDELDGT